ncbi:hypothetical protein VE02_07877 [Pseudogymnoascus sp. 03VT05]|nr:hypothetical protein VE02_07877 [Pseudogymnoascus sp. 03VT05]
MQRSGAATPLQTNLRGPVCEELLTSARVPLGQLAPLPGILLLRSTCSVHVFHDYPSAEASMIHTASGETKAAANPVWDLVQWRCTAEEEEEEVIVDSTSNATSSEEARGKPRRE